MATKATAAAQSNIRMTFYLKQTVSSVHGSEKLLWESRVSSTKCPRFVLHPLHPLISTGGTHSE